jgi:hypothetical protein
MDTPQCISDIAPSCYSDHCMNHDTHHNNMEAPYHVSHDVYSEFSDKKIEGIRNNHLVIRMNLKPRDKVCKI